jgi:hypothetical protein
MMPLAADFVRRANRNLTIDLVCTSCFNTVATLSVRKTVKVHRLPAPESYCQSALRQRMCLWGAAHRKSGSNPQPPSREWATQLALGLENPTVVSGLSLSSLWIESTG